MLRKYVIFDLGLKRSVIDYNIIVVVRDVSNNNNTYYCRLTIIEIMDTCGYQYYLNTHFS